MTSPYRSALRYIGFAGVASVVVAVLLVASLWAFGFLDRPAVHHAVDLRLLTQSERIDLAETLGEATGPQRPSLPPLDAIQPLEIPQRSGSGCVQVEFEVDGEGRVVDAEVVRSVPPGMFDEQALEIVRSRDYASGDPGRRTEVVDFSIQPPSR